MTIHKIIEQKNTNIYDKHKALYQTKISLDQNEDISECENQK